MMVLKSKLPDVNIPSMSSSNYFLELYKKGGNSVAFVSLL